MSANNLNTCERATGTCVFAQRPYLKKHQAGFLFGKTTRFSWAFQDGFRNGKKNIVSFYGNLLRVLFELPCLVAGELFIAP